VTQVTRGQIDINGRGTVGGGNKDGTEEEWTDGALLGPGGSFDDGQAAGWYEL